MERGADAVSYPASPRIELDVPERVRAHPRNPLARKRQITLLESPSYGGDANAIKLDELEPLGAVPAV